MCHPAFANYDTTILPDIYSCSDVYTQLQNNTQYEVSCSLLRLIFVSNSHSKIGMR